MSSFARRHCHCCSVVSIILIIMNVPLHRISISWIESHLTPIQSKPLNQYSRDSKNHLFIIILHFFIVHPIIEEYYICANDRRNFNRSYYCYIERTSLFGNGWRQCVRGKVHCKHLFTTLRRCVLLSVRLSVWLDAFIKRRTNDDTSVNP